LGSGTSSDRKLPTMLNFEQKAKTPHESPSRELLSTNSRLVCLLSMIW
jgi:hypothetical protein